MLIWSFVLVSMALAADTELKIENYFIKIKENTLESIYATEESSNDLNLSGLGLQALNKNAFDNVSNLKILILANNSLTRLPEFVFMNLTNLEHLCLADNKITEFENVFVGLKNLKSLNISNNPIKFLGKSYMYGLTESSELLTRGNSLLGISSALFENPFLRDGTMEKIMEADTTKSIARGNKEEEKRIKVCKIEDNVKLVDNLKENELLSSDCQEIKVDLKGKKLSLDNLGISKFDKNWYRLQDPSIKTISLADNKITTLTSELLNNLPENIKFVSLSGNKIERLEKGIVKNSQISMLDLSRNLISEIEDEALEETMLDELCLKDNRLSDTKFMASLPSSVMIINLEGNKIKEISVGSFSKFNQLRKLCLRDNKIADLSNRSLSGLSSLEDLDLSMNCIKEIKPGSFKDLKSVRLLNLHNNSIVNFKRGAFDGLNSLEALDIGSNEIANITKDFRLSLPRTLQRLRLDCNKIEILQTGSFINVPNETLSLNGNKISRIERGSFYLPNLMTLRLDNNLLSELDGESYVGLRNLKYLVLEANGITKIDKGFAKNLGNLESLNLSRNPIKKLENGALFGLPKWPDSNVYLVEVPVEIIQGGLFDNV